MSNSLRILITGASRGIGLALTESLLTEGHFVYAVSRSTTSLEELKVNHKNLTVIKADITEQYDRIIDSLSGDKLDHIINNAGYLVNKPLLSQSNIDIRTQYEVNAIAPLILIRELLSNMKEGSTICNISSMGGVQGAAKFPGLVAYSSSKGALTIMTECLAEELKEMKIRCNAVALGAVQTQMLEEAFPGYIAPNTPEEIATFIADFIVNRSKLFNGKVIPLSSTTP